MKKSAESPAWVCAPQIEIRFVSRTFFQRPIFTFLTKKIIETSYQNSCKNYLEWFREFWFVLFVARNFQLQPLKHLLHSELSKFAFCQLPIRKTQRPNADVRRIQTYHDGFLQSHLITRFHAHFWNRKRMPFLKILQRYQICPHAFRRIINIIIRQSSKKNI